MMDAITPPLPLRRSLGTLLMFIAATLVSFFTPYAGLALIFCALLMYLRPEPPGSIRRRSPARSSLLHLFTL